MCGKWTVTEIWCSDVERLAACIAISQILYCSRVPFFCLLLHSLRVQIFFLASVPDFMSHVEDAFDNDLANVQRTGTKTWRNALSAVQRRRWWKKSAIRSAKKSRSCNKIQFGGWEMSFHTSPEIERREGWRKKLGIFLVSVCMGNPEWVGHRSGFIWSHFHF